MLLSTKIFSTYAVKYSIMSHQYANDAYKGATVRLCSTFKPYNWSLMLQYVKFTKKINIAYFFLNYSFDKKVNQQQQQNK